KGNKWDKIPLIPITLKPARTNDPDTWGTLTDALTTYSDGKADGIGFVLGDGVVGVDLDDCRCPRAGELDGWALRDVKGLNTYGEVSPTATGVKLLAFAELPPGRRQSEDDAAEEVECYDETSPRYFTITGNRLPGTPADLQERQAEVEEWYFR